MITWVRETPVFFFLFESDWDFWHYKEKYDFVICSNLWCIGNLQSECQMSMFLLQIVLASYRFELLRKSCLQHIEA